MLTRWEKIIIKSDLIGSQRTIIYLLRGSNIIFENIQIGLCTNPRCIVTLVFLLIEQIKITIFRMRYSTSF